MDTKEQNEPCEEEEEEGLDPRIQGELEKLNAATNEINTLETEVDEARAKFRSLLTESTKKLNQYHNKFGKSIQRARPYYVALKAAKEAQTETQRAAISYQRAIGLYRAAKETVSLAEERLLSDGTREFDSAWQEMLNHATMRVMESEHEKTTSEAVHSEKAAVYQEAQSAVFELEKKNRRSITKARPYFDLKSSLEMQLQQQKQNVEDLQNAIDHAKKKYSETLNKLEEISEQIHARRKEKLLHLPPREPGVGADSDYESELPEVRLDSETVSVNTETDQSDSEETEESLPSGGKKENYATALAGETSGGMNENYTPALVGEPSSSRDENHAIVFEGETPGGRDENYTPALVVETEHLEKMMNNVAVLDTEHSHQKSTALEKDKSPAQETSSGLDHQVSPAQETSSGIDHQVSPAQETSSGLDHQESPGPSEESALSEIS